MPQTSLTKAPLIYDSVFFRVLSVQQGLPENTIKRIIEAYTASMIKEIKKGNRVNTGIGIYEVKHTLAYTGQNPRTNLPIPVAAKNRVLFTANDALKSAVN